MAISSDTLLLQSQEFGTPSITPERAADLTAEFNNLLEKATPLIERYRYLYADPFTFLSELEAQAHPDVSGE
jgi:hypothetical protein|tara:strand:- start:490 stop:705 length:216 start_codon:yes stop_codon:yes gene_type:complete